MNAVLPRWFRLFLGVSEIAAGVGPIVPGLNRIQPRQVPMSSDVAALLRHFHSGGTAIRDRASGGTGRLTRSPAHSVSRHEAADTGLRLTRSTTGQLPVAVGGDPTAGPSN
jgi:hypothetical protein